METKEEDEWKRKKEKEKREHSVTSWNLLFKFRSLSPVSMVVLYFEKGACNLL